MPCSLRAGEPVEHRKQRDLPSGQSRLTRTPTQVRRDRRDTPQRHPQLGLAERIGHRVDVHGIHSRTERP